MAKRFRELFKFGLPARFRTGEGELVQGTISMLLDASLQRIRYGLEARFPTRAGDSALALTGLDRGIRRGRTETRAHYAARLLRWRWPRGHRTRGSALALLEQVSEYFGGLDCNTIDVKGRLFFRSAAGAESNSFGYPWTWDTAGVTPRWARFWLVLASVAFDFDDAEAMRELMHGDTPWKPAGTRAEWLIIAADGIAVTPAATWLHWSRNIAGTQTATRNDAHRYVSLTPERNNTYAGDPSSFAANVPNLDGIYASNPDSFPAAVTLPDGSSYAGNPNSFPLSVRLFDDADWTLT